MRMRHPLSGAVYAKRDDGLVMVEQDGRTGLFRSDGEHVSGPLRSADPHMLVFLAGARTESRAPSADTAPRPSALPERPPRRTQVRYADLLDGETLPVPPLLRARSQPEIRTVRVPIERYTARAFHALEVERLWRRTWQMACREEQIPEAGDRIVYDIASLSFVIVRGSDGRIRAFPNTCLHRGRALVDADGHADALRCPFHGWTWRLDGTLASVPCGGDFPHVEPDAYRLPEARVGTWGGFVFVNPDPACEPLAQHLGALPEHFARWPLERRFLAAHVEKRLRCNWKVCQEAFMEAYHVAATHPQLLPGIGDTNSQIDAWDTFSRAITANMTPSPQLAWEPTQQEQLDSMGTADLDAAPAFRVPDGMTARQVLAEGLRAQLRSSVPDVEGLTVAELADSFYYTLFPNFHPWGAYNRLVYRFRPDGDRHDASIMDVYLLAPFAGERPAPAATKRLGAEDSWMEAEPEVGFLARIFSQDTHNLPRVQRGLEAAAHSHVTFSRDQELKIRHFHALLEKRLSA